MLSIVFKEPCQNRRDIRYDVSAKKGIPDNVDAAHRCASNPNDSGYKENDDHSAASPTDEAVLQNPAEEKKGGKKKKKVTNLLFSCVCLLLIAIS